MITPGVSTTIISRLPEVAQAACSRASASLQKILKSYAVVRVRRLVGQADDYDDWRLNQRIPTVGDIGTSLDVLTTLKMSQSSQFIFDGDVIFLWREIAALSVFHHEGGFAHIGW